MIVVPQEGFGNGFSTRLELVQFWLTWENINMMHITVLISKGGWGVEQLNVSNLLQLNVSHNP